MSLLLPARTPTFDAALRDARSDQLRTRTAAAMRLATPPEERVDEASRALERLADDPEPSVRELALESLGFLGDPDSLDIILARIEDQVPGVREAAIIAASRHDDPRVDEMLDRALESDDPEVRYQAIRSFADRHEPDAVWKRLSQFFDDTDPEIRAQAAFAMGRGEVQKAKDRLVSLLDDEATPSKEAALALAELGDDRGAAVLRATLKDPERAIAAALALGRVRDKGAAEQLAKIAFRPFTSLHFRAAAAAALTDLDDARGIDALRRVLGARRADGRGFAAELIAEREITDLVPEIVALVDRPRGADPVVLVRALGALSQSSDAARTALAALAERADEVGTEAREFLDE